MLLGFSVPVKAKRGCLASYEWQDLCGHGLMPFSCAGGGQGDPATSRAWEFGGRARKGAHAFGGEGWFVVAEGENVRGGRWVVPDDGYVGRI